eukprot:TRINITY_DN65270_c0_g1_i1.p1 TRINITY_DN65270_c0_g1~~TRINITY_DN65270_c0_g1_i1.p1  ORF type:complete len:1250 (+),score=310.38 TRINITY_DN65270_c0_g1_i1:76-3825(+)
MATALDIQVPLGVILRVPESVHPLHLCSLGSASSQEQRPARSSPKSPPAQRRVPPEQKPAAAVTLSLEPLSQCPSTAASSPRLPPPRRSPPGSASGGSREPELPRLYRRRRCRWRPPPATSLEELSLPKGTVPVRRVQRRVRNGKSLLSPTALWPMADPSAPPRPADSLPRCASPPPGVGRAVYNYTRNAAPLAAAAARSRLHTPACGMRSEATSVRVRTPAAAEAQITRPEWGESAPPPFARETESSALKRPQPQRNALSPLLLSLLGGAARRGSGAAADKEGSSEAVSIDDSGITGFEALQGSIWQLAREQKMLERQAGGRRPLDNIWQEAGVWLSRLPHTREIAGELEGARRKFEQSMRQGADFAKPCGPCIAAAFRCLDQLFGMLKRYLPAAEGLCASVRRELLAGVYSTPPGARDADALGQALESPTRMAKSRRARANAAVGDMYASRKTFFQAARMLAARLAALGTNAGQTQIKREREVVAWQRIVQHTEKRLVARVFNAWRSTRRRDREFADLHRELEFTKARLAALEQDMQVKVHTARRAEEELLQKVAMLESRLQPVDTQLQAQLQQLSALRLRLKEKDDEIEKVRAEGLKGKDSVREEYERLCMVLWDNANRLVDDRFSDNWEAQQRDRMAGRLLAECSALCTISNPAAASEKVTPPAAAATGLKEDQVLVRWMQVLLERSKVKDMLPFDDFHGQKNLDVIYVVLSQCSPGHINEDMVSSFLAFVDASVKAQVLGEACNALGVEMHLSGSDLAAIAGEHADRAAQAHQLLAASLFRRFCTADPGERQVQWIAADTDWFAAGSPIAQPDIHPDAVLTPDEWRQKMVAVMQRSLEWRLLGNRVYSWAWGRWARALGERAAEEEEDFLEGLSDLEQRDFATYTTVRREPIAELLDKAEGDGDPGSPSHGCSDAAAIIDHNINEAQRFLRRNFRRMRRAFNNFTLGTSPPRVMLDQFWRQLVDARVTDKAFARIEVARVFAMSNVDEDMGLDPEEWIIALVRLANAKFAQVGRPTDVFERLRMLLENHILKWHGGAFTDEFKKQIYDPRVQGVVGQYKKMITKIFRHYAELDSIATDRRLEAGREVEFTEFMQLLGDCRVMDPAPACTQHGVSQIFARVLGSETLDVQAQQQGMLLHEFVEALVGVACLKYASPFVPLHQKVQMFLEARILEPLDKKLKLGFERERQRGLRGAVDGDVTPGLMSPSGRQAGAEMGFSDLVGSPRSGMASPSHSQGAASPYSAY